MYLKSLSVKNFRKFKDFSIDFPSDITVVKGPNEKGKSTILLAVLAGLFYDPKKSNKEIDALMSWNSKKLYDIDMKFERDGNEIVLHKDFESKDMDLKDPSLREDLTNFKDISEYLYDFGSLRSLSLFESTACVRHDALTLLTKGKREISQALQHLLTSSSEEDVSPERIIKKINDALSDIRKGMKSASKSPGALKDLEEKIKVLEERRDDIKAKLDDLSAKVDYLSGIEDEFNAIKKDFDLKMNQYNLNEGYFKAINEMENLNLSFDRINADLEVLQELSKNKEYVLFQLNKMKALKKFKKNDLDKKKGILRENEAKFEYLKKHFKELEEREKEKGSSYKIYKYLALIFLLLGVGGFFNYWLFTFFILSAASFLASFVFKRRKLTKKRSGIVEEGKKIEENIERIKGEMENIYKENNVSNEDDLIKKIKTYNEFCQELSKIESKEEGILRGGDINDLKKERSELAKRISIEEEKISAEQKANIPTPQEQRLLEMDIDKEKDKLSKLEKEIVQVAAIVGQYNVDKEDLVIVEEEMEFFKERYKAFEKRVGVLETTLNVLKEAQSKTIARSKHHIEGYMRKYLAVITDGRYDNIEVNDDLSFSVWSDEKKGMIVPENHLSQGTIDQFYLVARFAILDALNKGKRSLILLDDPFHSFDDGRREKTREMLNDLTSKFQIVLFTHSKDYDQWGSVIEI